MEILRRWFTFWGSFVIGKTVNCMWAYWSSYQIGSQLNAGPINIFKKWTYRLQYILTVDDSADSRYAIWWWRWRNTFCLFTRHKVMNRRINLKKICLVTLESFRYDRDSDFKALLCAQFKRHKSEYIRWHSPWN